MKKENQNKNLESKKQNLKENDTTIIQEEQVRHVVNEIVSETTLQVRSSHLPPPEELKDYKNIDKSFPDRIISMSEKEQKFRHLSTYIGQIFFLLLIMGGFTIAGFVSFYSSYITGSVIAGAIGYIAYVFKNEKPKPPIQKDK